MPALYFLFLGGGQSIINNGALNTQNEALDNNVALSQNNDKVLLGSGLPVRLSIPNINVDAEVIYVGLAKDGSVDVPKGPSQVAWFKLGPRPGDKGSAVITGHFGPWQTGASSVFDNLYKLKKGDKIYIKDDKGVSIAFTVRESREYGPGESLPEVFNKNDGIYLNLITCHGDWLANQKTYTQRLVVFADADT